VKQSRREALTFSLLTLVDVIIQAKTAGAEQPFTLAPVLETINFQVAPCRDCDVPGYLILLPRTSASLISDMTTGQQSSIGAVLGILEKVAISATGAERVYIMRFSEALGDVHFHLFPRTKSLGDNFKADTHPTEEGINAPLLFAWARKKYFVSSPAFLSKATLNTAKLITNKLKDINNSRPIP
jgi:diadenosine tetraphosphate (Ap4A) HIT family hydrolase